MRRLTLGSLFAGIDGFGLGFERAGCEVVWQVEIGKHPTRVLERHWPGVRRERDVRECGVHNLERVDIITFGSPCQGLSVAGKQRGFADARSHLFFEACRIIAELRPTFALWENVPNALSVNAGRDFTTALMALAELGPADLCWATLNAQYFGVPQRRRRIFALLDFGGERAAEILLDPASVLGDFTPSRRTGAHVARPLTASAGVRGAEEVDHGNLITSSEWRQDAIAYALRADPAGVGQGHNTNYVFTAFSAKDHGADAAEDLAPTLRAMGHRESHPNAGGQIAVMFHTTQDPISGPVAPCLGATGDALGVYQCHGTNVGPMGTLRGGNGNVTGGVPFLVQPAGVDFGQITNSANRARVEPGWPMPTLVAQGEPAVVDESVVRKITPLEAERLQGFPEGHTCTCGVTPYSTWTCRCPDGPRQEALGNAVAVPCAEWIARRLIAAAMRECAA